MIRDFANGGTRKLFEGAKSKAVPLDTRERTESKLATLAAVRSLKDLRMPPGNRLEALRGERAGQYSIRINRQYRLCFGFDEDTGDAYEVEITDYHG